MIQPSILLVESDVLVRHPLAEYLRVCGYRVREANNTEEAQIILDDDSTAVDIVLADVDAPGESGFALAAWIRRQHPGVKVILAGSVAKATEKAGDLCQEGPKLTKPYEHHFVLDQIRRLRAMSDQQIAKV